MNWIAYIWYYLWYCFQASQTYLLLFQSLFYFNQTHVYMPFNHFVLSTGKVCISISCWRKDVAEQVKGFKVLYYVSIIYIINLWSIYMLWDFILLFWRLYLASIVVWMLFEEYVELNGWEKTIWLVWITILSMFLHTTIIVK
jgi:hypothetical protein